jgi:hypothetical protein
VYRHPSITGYPVDPSNWSRKAAVLNRWRNTRIVSSLV